MTSARVTPWLDRRTGHRLPWWGCLVLLGLCLALVALPVRLTAPVKGWFAASLSPVLQRLVVVRDKIGQAAGALCSSGDVAEQLAAAQRELERLRAENLRLASDAAPSAKDPLPSSAAAPALLKLAPVEARVLGHQALAFLSAKRLLGAGARQAVHPGAVVLAAADRTIDQGNNAKIPADALVVSGQAVWGRIAEVGPQTSYVRSVYEADYRDVVQLLAPGAAKDNSAPILGVLEGTGQRLARIRRVDTTVPVSVGDRVYAAGDRGITPLGLFYGNVVRVERGVASGFWEIWMEPAVDRRGPDRVLVLCASVNPQRSGDPPCKPSP